MAVPREDSTRAVSPLPVSGEAAGSMLLWRPHRAKWRVCNRVNRESEGKSSLGAQPAGASSRQTSVQCTCCFTCEFFSKLLSREVVALPWAVVALWCCVALALLLRLHALCHGGRNCSQEPDSAKGGFWRHHATAVFPLANNRRFTACPRKGLLTAELADVGADSDSVDAAALLALENIARMGPLSRVRLENIALMGPLCRNSVAAGIARAFSLHSLTAAVACEWGPYNAVLRVARKVVDSGLLKDWGVVNWVRPRNTKANGCLYP